MTPLSTSASESPGESVQGARKRETLISRAKRIIGRELDSPEDSGGKHGKDYMLHDIARRCLWIIESKPQLDQDRFP
jgi:hypothetical protein